MSLKIALLSSESSWMCPSVKNFNKTLVAKGISSTFFTEPELIDESYDIVFILSYFNILNDNFLTKHKYNLVIHESDLPQGRGWAPLFWQVIEGKSKIPIVLFEAASGVDTGKIYLRDIIELDGFELHDEIRQKQVNKTFELCERFIDEVNEIIPTDQSGPASYYQKRSPEDSVLSADKTLREQFNKLRVASNELYPAFFVIDGKKYKLKIEHYE